MQRERFRKPMIILGTSCLALIVAACSVGYGTRIGYQKKTIQHKGCTTQEIFEATLSALEEVGIVRSSDMQQGVIAGDIPPYSVNAVVASGSEWLKLEGRELEKGTWKRDATKGEWFLSIDCDLYYRRGAETIQDALRQWSRAINKRIPAR